MDVEQMYRVGRHKYTGRLGNLFHKETNPPMTGKEEYAHRKRYSRTPEYKVKQAQISKAAWNRDHRKIINGKRFFYVPGQGWMENTCAPFPPSRIGQLPLLPEEPPRQFDLPACPHLAPVDTQIVARGYCTRKCCLVSWAYCKHFC